MIVSCKRENLARGLAIVSRVVKQRATLPVLSNIMISTDKGRLKLSATDLEVAVCAWIGGKIDEEGAITVPARTFSDYILATGDETIAISVKGSDIALTGERAKTTIKGLEASEFPTIPEVGGKGLLKVKTKELKRAIFSTGFAAALDETRPVLAGILLRGKGGKLILAATDSYRLAEKTISCDGAGAFEAIIPARSASELGRILPQDDSEAEVRVNEDQVELVFADIQFTSRKIEGAFPDYEQIIPGKFACEFEAQREELAEAIRVANVFAREVGGNIKVSAAEGKAVINAVSSQVGDTQATLPVDFSGSPTTVAFNAKYILDALGVIEGERIKVGFSGELNPGLIADKSDDTLKYVVMPLRSE